MDGLLQRKNSLKIPIVGKAAVQMRAGCERGWAGSTCNGSQAIQGDVWFPGVNSPHSSHY